MENKRINFSNDTRATPRYTNISTFRKKMKLRQGKAEVVSVLN